MFRGPVRTLALALAAALVPAMAQAGQYAVTVTALPGSLFEILGEDALVDAPDCLRPAVRAPAQLDVEARRLRFPHADRACRIERLLRRVEPEPGLHDLRLTRRGRDLYETRLDGWVLETAGCPVEARETATRVVIAASGDRLLFTAPDHPDASITGRVTCALKRVFSEVRF